MQALWHIDKHHSELRKVSSNNNSNLINLHAAYSLISTGSERLVASGKVPLGLENQMQVPYMEGNFALPIKYGYSMIAKSAEGNYFHIMHPHQDIIAVDATHLYQLPDDVPVHRLALISNMETIINAIWDAYPSKEHKIAVCGFGNIGSLLATTLRVHFGIEADIIEQNTWRKAKAEQLNWNTETDTDYDIIFHTTATGKGLQYCIDHLNIEGKVIELSWYGDRKVELSLGATFHYKRLQIISSQVSSIPKSKQANYNYKTRKDLAIQWLRDDSYDQLISDFISFKDAPAFFEALRKNKQGNGLIWMIEY